MPASRKRLSPLEMMDARSYTPEQLESMQGAVRPFDFGDVYRDVTEVSAGMVLVGHCRDCRWWGGEGPQMGANRWWQACRQVIEPEAKVVLSAYDPYVATTQMTRRDYGCVQFEPRPLTAPKQK